MRILRVYLSILVICSGCTKASGAYAHYFTWHGPPNEMQLRQCLAEMRQVIDSRRDLVVGPDGPGSAIFVDQLNLNFNGFGNDAQGWFVFPGAQGYNSCRTDRHAYDMVVTACLLVARDHFTDLELGIASDGSWEAGDWSAGAKLYSSALNRTALNPIGGRGDFTHWFKKPFVIPVLLVLAFGIWRWWSNRNQEAE